jgi:membrane-bound lytic murein transglycosylase D
LRIFVVTLITLLAIQSCQSIQSTQSKEKVESASRQTHLNTKDSADNLGSSTITSATDSENNNNDDEAIKDHERQALIDSAGPEPTPEQDLTLEPALKSVSTPVINDVWKRIEYQLSLEIPNHPRLEKQKRWYLKHPRYVKQISERARPYLFHIVEALEANQLPLELALLPIVESSFDPFAYSHGQASGLWQFIPGTGKQFGLKQNWWYDGRRDVYASTQAAIKLLKYLHKRFDGDWLHALAAYNSGEGNVNKAIRRNKKQGKPTDFWSLKLPKETQAYVPKLLALASLLAEMDSTDWLPIENQPYFDRVVTNAQIDLRLAASLADIDMSEFYRLNPGFNQWATAPKGPHHFLLPVEKVTGFKNALAEIPENKRILFKPYTIKSGDSLSVIANKFNISIDLIKKNNTIRGNKIIAGKQLLIPVSSDISNKHIKLAQQHLSSKRKVSYGQQKTMIKVSPGDSLWTLSRKHKVSIRNLARWNNMKTSDTLRQGKELVIWHGVKESIGGGPKRKIYYTVRRGDSFGSIANQFNVNLLTLKRWNPKDSRKKYLQPGDSILIYVDIAKTSS